MNLEKKQTGNAAVLSVIGRVDSGNAEAFEAALLPEVEQEPTGVVINFESLDYISSAGMRVVLMAAKKARQADIIMVLCALNEEIAELFQMTGFDSIMTIEGTLEAALSHFRSG